MNKQEADRAIIAWGNNKWNDFMRYLDTLDYEGMTDFLVYVKDEHDMYFEDIFREICNYVHYKNHR